MSGHEFQSFFPESGGVDLSDQATNITDETIEEMRQLAARYPQARSALLPMLHLVQSVDGRVSPRGIEACAEVLGISAAQVSGVATFYTMYKRRPAGKHHVGVCVTALCAVMGGDALMEHVEDKLGIHPGETTADGTFSLEAVECNAACDFAPVMMVNWEFMDNMDPEKADRLLDDLAAGKPVESTVAPPSPAGRRPSGSSPASPTAVPTRAPPPAAPRWWASGSPTSVAGRPRTSRPR